MKSESSSLVAAALCAAATLRAATVTTDAPGWVFRQTEQLIFSISDCQKSQLSIIVHKWQSQIRDL